jgi:hypothetical protein
MKQPLNEQFRRMQKLAGIITENQIQEMDMKIQHLINNTYQVVDNDDNVLLQGSESECNDYIMNKDMENLLNRINKNQINEDSNFDYQERKSGDVIVMDDKTMDDILDDLELQDYINPKSFTRNNKGEIVLGVDHMDYEQFDKLAKFLGIKY